MKKVCHIVDRLNVGGLERTLVGIVAGLKEYDHHVWCLDTKGALAGIVEDRGVEVREFGFKGGVGFSSLGLLVKEMKKSKFDIVHSHGLYPSIWARLAAIGAHVPVRIDHVQNMYTQAPFIDKIKLLALAYFTTKIIAVSEAAKRSLAEEVKIPSSKITVIYNSSSDMKAAALDARPEVRRELGLNESFAVGSIGRLEKHKGHSFLIDAIKICRDGGIGVKCVITGSGPEEDELKKKITELRLERFVFLLGVRSDIGRILSGVDTLVQPSTLVEGLPLVLAEGASMALPLIATSIGGNTEIVEDGKNGYIVPPKDAAAIAGKIKELILNPDRAKEMGAFSRKIWRERFTLEDMLAKIKSVYENSQRNNS